jgi:nucleoside-diphosphate-sugar epimerase
MKVLFIGGTGTISSACTELALKQDIELYHFNRGQSHRKYNGVKNIKGDIRNFEDSKNILHGMFFDVVVDWICFTEEHAKNDISLFAGKSDQFIFISSASAYKKPVDMLPITEETPLENKFWEYSRNKIKCEKLFLDAYKNVGFPITIVRPSHTYDRTLIPFEWGYTVIDRILKNKKIIIHGDGTSLWVMTHNTDFAKGFNGLFGKKQSIGEAYHITGDELLNWNLIYRLAGNELGKELDIVHIPSDYIASYDTNIGSSLLGDKAHSVIFNNAKIKNLVPEFKQTVKFEDGMKEIVSWYKNNPSWQKVDDDNNFIMDLIIHDYLTLASKK